MVRLDREKDIRTDTGYSVGYNDPLVYCGIASD